MPTAENFVGDRAYTIEWECRGFDGVGAEIFVEFYDGRGWRCLWRGEPAESKFEWRLPNIDSVYCKIRVRVVDGSLSRTAASEAFFIIERGATERSMSIEIDDDPPDDDVVVVEPTVKQFAPDDEGSGDDVQRPEGSEESTGSESTETEPVGMAALLLEGNELLSRGEHDKAARAFARCIEISPDAVEALYGLGQARYRAGRLAEAREALRRATELNDDHADAHYCLGRIAMKLAGAAADPAAERRSAKRHFLRVILIDPKYGEAYNDLGKVFFDGGEVEDAYRNFRRAVDCDGGDKIFLYNAGRAAYALGERQACLDYCKRALAIDAKFRYPCWLAAKCCSELAKVGRGGEVLGRCGGDVRGRREITRRGARRGPQGSRGAGERIG